MKEQSTSEWLLQNFFPNYSEKDVLDIMYTLSINMHMTPNLDMRASHLLYLFGLYAKERRKQQNSVDKVLSSPKP